MATYITKNIRELEGALITLFAYARLTKQEITLPTAEEVLSDLIGRDKIRPTTVEDIQRAVAERFDSRISDLRGRSRQRHIAYPRQIAMYLCKELIPSMSLSEIGDAFGGKDHTTVLYAHQKIDKELKKNPETRRQVTQLNQQLRG
jgi:chromosomal replication initiator protein